MAHYTAGKKRPGAPVQKETVDKKDKPTFYELMGVNPWADCKEIEKIADEKLKLGHKR